MRGDESFADDLNEERGIVSSRVTLLLRSAEIKPLFPRFVPWNTSLSSPSFFRSSMVSTVRVSSQTKVTLLAMEEQKRDGGKEGAVVVKPRGGRDWQLLGRNYGQGKQRGGSPHELERVKRGKPAKSKCQVWSG